MRIRTGGDPADFLFELGRHWGLVLAYGIVTVLVGILALVWPDATLVVAAVLFGIQLVVAGIFRLVSALATGDESGGTRALMAVLGVLTIVVGLYAVRHVLITVVALAIVLGIFWIVNGTMELFAAASARGVPGRGWAFFSSALSVVAGIIVLVYPGISLLTLTVVLGVWLVALGAINIVAAFRLRSGVAAAASLAPA